jgi:hypothetical protein
MGTSPFGSREVHASASYADQVAANIYESALAYGTSRGAFVDGSYDFIAARSTPGTSDVSAYRTGLLAGWQFDIPTFARFQFCPLASVAYYRTSATLLGTVFDTHGEVYRLGGAVGLALEPSKFLTVTPSVSVLFVNTSGTGQATFDGATESFSGSNGNGLLDFAVGATFARLTVTPFVLAEFEKAHGGNWWGVGLSYSFGK